VAESQENLGKGKKSKGSRKQADDVAAWERFCEEESGVYPPYMAAAYLKMTIQGVYAAANRGWLRYFVIGRERFYSRRDCVEYRWTVAKSYRDARPLPKFKHRVMPEAMGAIERTLYDQQIIQRHLDQQAAGRKKEIEPPSPSE
jgi:hypothetical protein